jgi:plastocyanin
MTGPMSLRPVVFAAIATTCLVLTGCGDDPPVTVENRTLTVELDEYRILPEDAVVRPGRLRIAATNVGRLTHNLKIVRERKDDREAPPIELGGTATAQPGDTVSATFERLRPGRYRMVCTISNHDDLGQYGELIVRGRKEG